jgi:murein DD-endopeptidase MepM/ murein hydrolase activator NlpD
MEVICVTSSAPKRRLDVRQETPRPTSGKRVAQRRRSKRTFVPTPAMAGAFALILAAFGSAVVGGATDENSLRADKYQTINQSYTGPDQASTDDVDVTRGVDRRDFDRQVMAQAEQKQALQAALAKKVTKESDKAEQNLWMIPVTGYHLSARFGQSSGLWSTVHTGLDFAGPAGTTIVSIGAGTVKSTAYEGAYGNRTIITLADGTDIWYCHQSSFAVKPGDVVSPGDTIGYTGSTGNVTGPHLHLEIHPLGGAAVDPYAAMAARGATP